MHGGTVQARSRGRNMGSEFLVRLPVGRDRPQPPLLDSPQPFPKERILIVDDNRDAAESLSTLLNALGATVSVAYSGREALEALDVIDPDVLLLDIGMPGIDGYEVARRIRSTRAHAGVLIIALTGWGQAEDRARAARAGFDHHLVKPLDIDQLRSLVVEHAANPARHAHRLHPK